MSSPVHLDQQKYILILVIRQGFDGTASTAEKQYSINFAVTRKKFCSSLHYNGSNSYLFVNGTEIIKCKAKNSEIVAFPLCLENVSKIFPKII